jgi:hypothetical protein
MSMDRTLLYVTLVLCSLPICQVTRLTCYQNRNCYRFVAHVYREHADSRANREYITHVNVYINKSAVRFASVVVHQCPCRSM